MKPAIASWRRTPGVVLLFAGLLTAAACGSEPDDASEATPPPVEPSASVAEESTTVPDDAQAGSNDPAPATNDLATATADLVLPAGEADGLVALPVREGPRERTTESVPHIQLDAAPVPEVDAELRLRAFSIPGVQDEPSAISLAGARALWLSDDIDLARPEILLSGREFAHIHPDGSLHVWLPVERAIEVEEAAWGELHPWVDRDDFWDGVAMVFTPKTSDDVDIVMQLLVEAYNYVSGFDLDPHAY